MPQDIRTHFKSYEYLRRDDGGPLEWDRDFSGVTYKVRDVEMDLPFALKIFDPIWVGGANGQAFLLRNLAAAAAVRHPNAARIIEFGREAEDLFCVTEWIEGETLDEFVKRQGPILPALALWFAFQVISALQAAGAGVVHGNLNPSHLMVVRVNEAEAGGETSNYNLKLIGLGASMNGPGFHASTGGIFLRTGTAGTTSFTSPEELEQIPVDTRADLYGLGATLWFMLTGKPCFEGESIARAAAQIPGREPPWEQLAGEPKAVVNLLTRLLARDPARRLATAEQASVEIMYCREILYRATRPEEVRPTAGAAAYSVSYAASARRIDIAQMVSHAAGPDEKSGTTSASSPLNDENVQFTAYRPRVVRPARWEKLLVFAHLDERPRWLDPDECAPVEEVAAQAAAVLGPKLDRYRQTTDDSRLMIPRDGEITLVPELPGFEFNPPRRSFFWKDGVAVHGETFEMRASAAMDGRTARGRLTIFLGALILADINLAIRVDSRAGAVPSSPAAGSSGPVTVRPFRRIFASYSHRDLAIVEMMERHARSLGDEYLRDWVHLRSGEQWDERLRALVKEADVFQLFWSGNAARSEFVEREWRYALELRREAFVRPTYWQEPMPTPPEPLASIHFHRLGFDAPASAVTPPFPPPEPLSVPVAPSPPARATGEMAKATDADARPRPTRFRRSVASLGLLTALLLMSTLFLYQENPGYRVLPTAPGRDAPAIQAGMPPMSAPPPTDGAVERPNFSLEADASAQARLDLLSCIDRIPHLSDALKARLTSSVDHARGMGCIFVIPFGVGKKTLDGKETDILVNSFKSASIRNLLDDPTVVLVVMGYADKREGEAASEKTAMDRAQNVLGIMRDKCGVQNIMYAVGISSPTTIDTKSATKNRLVEIWALAP